MDDDSTEGIDLTGTPWPSVRLRHGTNEVSAETSREIPGQDVLCETAPLLLPDASGDPGLPVLDDWKDLRDRLRQIREPIRDQLPSQTLFGIAYPRSTSPILRQYLPIVFGSEPATSQGGLPALTRLVGLDAPVALALEAIASGEIPPEGRYAVATGQGRTREWTAMTIELTSSSNTSIQHPILWLRPGRTSATLAALGVDPATPRIVAGDEDVPLDQAGSVVRLAASATATGAARFARWRELEFSKKSTRNDKRIQSNLLPGAPVVVNRTIHPLGLMGCNGRGRWFWRRLYEPEMPIPSPRVHLRSMTLPPCHLFFAECTSPKFRSTRWLSQDEWSEAGLRWYSSFYHLTKNASEPPVLWSIELRDFNDNRRDAVAACEEVPPRWALPTWITRIEETTEEANDPLTPIG